jgi:ubiquinone/menaquinone biosynthesis C-methylase UbiE
MENGRFDRDKINAAKELLAATKGAEKMQLDIGIGTTDKAINLQEQLNQQIAQLVANQQLMLQTGANIDEVQKVGININYVDAEVEEVPDGQN